MMTAPSANRSTSISRRRGTECHTAVTGTDGLNKFVQVQPDLVILDIRLPDIDGFTVLEELREDDEDVKVIMITAFHDMDTTIRAMKAGAYDYITSRSISTSSKSRCRRHSRPWRRRRRSAAC